MKSSTRTNNDPNSKPINHYLVYTAGRMFSQAELAFNVFLREAVWRCSNQQFELLLPQSNQPPGLDQPDAALRIRNYDLVNVIKADALLAIFDGLETDAGAVAEFMMAKFLGKPTVILRCDSRGIKGDGFDEPYNLMIKNWPRNVTVHVDSMLVYSRDFLEPEVTNETRDLTESVIQSEMAAIHQGYQRIGQSLASALEEAVQMKSPYPPDYQEMVYHAARFAPGSCFEQMISDKEIIDIVNILKLKGTI